MAKCLQTLAAPNLGLAVAIPVLNGQMLAAPSLVTASSLIPPLLRPPSV